MATIKDSLNFAANTLKAVGIESTQLDAEIILAHILSTTREDLLIRSKEDLPEDTAERFKSFVERRSQGEPVAYIIEKRAFFGAEFKVRKGVLIPRPETEFLVEEALQWLARQSAEEFYVADLGCGSGCIGLSILQNSLNSKLIAVDKSHAACELTTENAELLGLSERVQVIPLDLSVGRMNLAQPMDIVVANPPYISPDDNNVDKHVRQFEPHEALFSGKSGYEHIETWKNTAAEILRPGGILIMEFGFTQGPKTKQIFESDPAFESVRIGKDLSGNDRYVFSIRSTN